MASTSQRRSWAPGDPERVRSLWASAAPGLCLVLGQAGSGKSTLLAELAREAALDGTRPVLMLSTSRLGAERAASSLSSGLPSGLGASRSLSWAAYAFDLISRAEALGLVPWVKRKPRLRTGAEQDQIFHELLRRVDPSQLPDSLKLASGTQGLRQQLRDFADQALMAGADPETEIARLGREHGRAEWILAAELLGQYQRTNALAGREAFDALELGLAAVKVLRENPGFADEERERWAGVFIDDAQNLTGPELELLFELLGQERPTGAVVFAAVDAASTVQAFRGANPERTYRALAPRARRAVDLGSSRRMAGSLERVYHQLSGYHAFPRIPLAVDTEDFGSLFSSDDSRSEATPSDHSSPCASRPEQSTASAVTGLSQADREGKQPDRGAVEAVVVSHPLHEMRYIATQVLELAVAGEDPIGFGEIAVVVRSQGLARQLERQFNALGIPVDIPPSVLTLKETPAVKPLLDVLGVVVSGEPGDPLVLAEILTSPMIGLTSVGMKQLRQALRQRERSRIAAAGESGHPRLSDELLVEASEDILGSASLEGLGTLSRMIAAGRKAYEAEDGDPQQVLWAVWEASGRVHPWKSAAAKPGKAGDRANRDLDAIMSLFHAAERYMDQRPGGEAGEFLSELLRQDVPVDTVAKKGHGQEAVAILTPATSAGRQFEAVFIAGLQDGMWPNPRIRGEIFGTTDFLEALGALRTGEPFAPSTRRDRVSAVKKDELRLFLTSLSRARRLAVLTSVRGDDASPSIFFDLAAEALGLDSSTIPAVHLPRPRTLRALIGELRQSAEHLLEAEADSPPDLQDSSTSSDAGRSDDSPARPAGASREASRDAARLLAGICLAEDLSEASLASPEAWWAARGLSSTGPVLPADSEISVSPSHVQKAIEDPLGWFVQSIGGEPAVDFSRQMGTLVHEIAEQHPEGTLEELQQALDDVWESLPPGPVFLRRGERAKADHLVRSLAQYIRQARTEGRSASDDSVEVRFDTALETGVSGVPRQLRLRGSVDRIEVSPEGRRWIVDLKTGKNSVTQAEARVHPQMAVYQLAVAEGSFSGFDSTEGAYLVYLGKDNVRRVSTVFQPSEDMPELGLQLVREAAETMTASAFASVQMNGRSTSRLREIDPLLPEGRPVTHIGAIPQITGITPSATGDAE